MSAFASHPIGIVETLLSSPPRPEVIRALESRLVLRPRFARAVATLEVGQNLWVVCYLHHVEGWQGPHMAELFTRRIACCSNPIGVTLTRVVAFEDSMITVVGLDAIDGSPALDIKPCKPIYDAPPAHPQECEA